MCGIVGFVGKKPFRVITLMNSLKRLEYRGYDSCGFATANGLIKKDVGEIENFINGLPSDVLETRTNIAIAHTRWATHGGVTQTNAHPHTACTDDFMVVHNGIIENFEELKKELECLGHEFRTETDTETIVHFIEQKYRQGKSVEGAVRDFMNRADGTFAVLLLKKNEDKIYAFKRDSPLVLGIKTDEYVLASDIYAFSNKTNMAVFFEDDEYAIITPHSFEFFDKNGKKLKKEIKTFEWTTKQETMQDFKHFMIKEIHEQPLVVERLLKSLENDQHNKISRLKQMIEDSKRVVFVAAGTSYFASLLGVYFLNKVGVEAHAIIASEFLNFFIVDKDTLVIAISQSGETMDVIKALKPVKEKGAKIAAIVNVPYSTVQRMADISLEVLAGQEICVAATKSFTNQVTLLLYLASLFGYDVNFSGFVNDMNNVIKNEEKIKKLATDLRDKKDIYVIGRGLSYPVAREIALKLKEISYIHAEGMMGGELKHGTIALIEPGTPVISLIPDNDADMVSNTKEVEARGAKTIIISSDNIPNTFIQIPEGNHGKFAILSNIVGQLLTYYIALEKNLPIDKPRNLAKSVTVK